eukprot:1676085-Lingulodinium_polyedra.AAC.1
MVNKQASVRMQAKHEPDSTMVSAGKLKFKEAQAADVCGTREHLERIEGELKVISLRKRGA